MLELIETERATIALGVPTVLIALLECPDLATRDLSSLRVVVSGGATGASRAGAPYRGDAPRVDSRSCTATTECSPLVSQVRLDDSFRDKTETLGRPVPQTEVKIADPADG